MNALVAVHPSHFVLPGAMATMSERFLSLTLLGSMQVEVNGEPVRGIESSKGRGLLAYLVVESDRPHSRESLATLFWPEESQTTALRNLRQVLYNLGRALPGGGKRRRCLGPPSHHL